jgi:RHS repeat-associated protein
VAGQQQVSLTGYDANNNIVSETDPRGVLTRSTYDALNRRIQTDAALGNPEQRTTVRAYDAANNLLTQTTGLSPLSGYAHPSTTGYAYDALNRQTLMTEALGVPGQQRSTATTYDPVNNVLSVTDPLTRVTANAYDALNRRTTQTQALGTAEQRTATMVYDAVNNLLATTTGIAGNPTYAAPVTTLSGYDALNRRTLTTEAAGSSAERTSLAAYDAANNVVQATDPLSQLTNRAYDALNRLTQTDEAAGTLAQRTTTQVYDAANNTTSITRGLSSNPALNAPVTENDAYDTLNRKTLTTEGVGGLVERAYATSYDGDDNIAQVRDTRGNLARYTYDLLNRRIRTDEAVALAEQRTTTEVYDAADNVLFETTGISSNPALQVAVTTAYLYDTLNRRVQMTEASGTPVARVTTLLYDALGNTTQVIDPRSHSTRFAYDNLDRRTLTLDALNQRTTVTYDALGRAQSVRDPGNNVTAFRYDPLGRTTQMTDTFGNSATYAYDRLNRLTSTTDRLGRRRDLQYDPLNRLQTETWVVGGSTVDTRQFSYNAHGSLLTAGNNNGTTLYTFTYDDHQRPTRVQEPYGLALTYAYDPANNRTLVQDSLGGVTTSTYDARQRLTSRQFSGTSLPAVRLDLTWTSHDQPATLTRYGSLDTSQRVGLTSYQYDPAGRLASVQHQNASSSVLASYSYTYEGHRLKTETSNGTTVTYRYDDTDQLLNDGVQPYTYDSAGNRNNNNFVPGPDNRLTTDGTWTYTYDAEGNLTKKSKGTNAETWTYGYDLRNQMVWAQDKSTDTDAGTLLLRADYKYDVFGNRLEKNVWTQATGNVITRFGYDGPNIWTELDATSGTNQPGTRRLYLDAVDQLYARVQPSGDVRWYMTDIRGSVRDLQANDGSALTVLDHLDYDGFGKVVRETNPSNGDRYQYTGREYDRETGLQYNRARYYDPQTERWTSEDPKGFAAGDANLYRYVHNDPTDRTDPSGLIDESVFWDNVEAVAAGDKFSQLALNWFRSSGYQKNPGRVVWEDRGWWNLRVLFSSRAVGVMEERGQTPVVYMDTSLDEAKATEAFYEVLTKRQYRGFQTYANLEKSGLPGYDDVRAMTEYVQQWMKDAAGLTAEAAKAVIEVYAGPHGNWTLTVNDAVEGQFKSAAWRAAVGAVPFAAAGTVKVVNKGGEVLGEWTGKQLSKLRQAYKKAHGGSLKGFKAPKGTPPNGKSGLGINPRRPEDAKPTFSVKDSWGRDIPVYGQGERMSSTTPGHSELMKKIVEMYGKSGEYEYFTLQRTVGFSTGQGSGRKIPDVIGVRRDGKVDVWEVESRTDNPFIADAQIKRLLETLPEKHRGTAKVLRPRGLEKDSSAINDMRRRGQDHTKPPVEEMDWP